VAQYKHLPIYKLTYDLLLRMMVATHGFSREYKYTIGQRMKDETIDLIANHLSCGWVQLLAHFDGHRNLFVDLKFLGFKDQLLFS